MLARIAFGFTVLAACTVQAAGAQFHWPESYSLTTHEISREEGGEVFSNTYFRDGLKARNENAREGIVIFRLDEHKKITVKPDGSVQETTIPASWPISNIFPKDKEWEMLGNDLINGVPAHKYKITRDPARDDLSMNAPFVLFWLSADGKMPLRMEDGDRVVEFSDYKAGKVAAKLFEAPKK